MNLQESLSRARTDHSAFKEIYDLTINRVYSFVLLRTGDKEVALDVCQNVYLSLWQSLSRFEYLGEAHFYAYLFKITRGEIIRIRKKIKPVVSLEDIYDFPADTPDHEDYRALSREMSKLSDEERACLELRYFEDRKFKDVGDALGISENYAKVLHHRAISKLREKFEGHE
jgi:RNA polymerase sigma-70 factor, ECF subfamily